MLVISRRTGEKVRIAEAIEVTVIAISGNQVKLGIDAPKDVSIVREELLSGAESFASDYLAGDINKPAPRGIENKGSQ
jgi:carbon storage regulator